MSILKNTKHLNLNLRTKLFALILLLIVVFLFVVFALLMFAGNIGNAETDMHKTLKMQMEVFSKQVQDSFESLSVGCMRLSKDASYLIDAFLSDKNLSFENLKDSSELIGSLQNELFEPLKTHLLQANCSGAFIMFNTTVNSASDNSSSGIYLQLSGFEFHQNNVLLFRGDALNAKNKNIFPHRKWRMEFNNSLFPNFADLEKLNSQTSDEAIIISDVFSLQGTNEKAILLILPILSKSGESFGYCGYEINQSYFKQFFSQPSTLNHLTCFLSKVENNLLSPEKSLSSGIKDGYYLEPSESLYFTPGKQGMLSFFNNDSHYLGIKKIISPAKQSSSLLLSVMVPKADIDKNAKQNSIQLLLIIILLLFFAAALSYYLSKKFISPILKGLDALKKGNAHKTDIPEIDDLFDFLSKKDLEREEEITKLKEKAEIFEDEFIKAQKELSLLAAKKKDEIDKENYEMFLNNLHTLTKREREIFDMYLEGKNAKEIHETVGINENTIKFHNKNIYSKLGVSSRKQLLQYAMFMKQQEQAKQE